MRGLGAGVFFSLAVATVAGPFGAGTAVAAPALATASLDAPSWAIAPTIDTNLCCGRSSCPICATAAFSVRPLLIDTTIGFSLVR